MKTTLHLTIAAFVLAAFNLSAATLYVSLESRNPVIPYATWATAATNIQDAVDAAKDGDTVLVTNGVYAVGSRPTVTHHDTVGWLTNSTRVVVTSAIRLQSVNGPTVTTINGGAEHDQYGYATNGVRCVFLGSSTVLSGFTLTNGYSEMGGGANYLSATAILTNCVLAGNSSAAAGWAAAVLGGTLYNCVLTENRGGDAAYSSTLYDCRITRNFGGSAAASSTLYGCIISDNRQIGQGDSDGGGVRQSTLYNCLLTGNSASGNGGAASYSFLYNCTLSDNFGCVGGGAWVCTLYNCVVADNLGCLGGGAYYCSLYNCTVTGNSAQEGGGGVCGGTLYNCIVYYNAAPIGANFSSCGTELPMLDYCCTTPLPTNGVGNITGPPLFMDMVAGDFSLREGSPCIDAGVNLLGMPIVPFEGTMLPYNHDPTDILGNTRFIDGNGDGRVAWDIGAYEFKSFKPPMFTAPPQLAWDGWKLTVAGATNKWVRVQRSSDLRNWEDVPIYPFVFMGESGAAQCTDWETGQRVRFYRAVVP